MNDILNFKYQINIFRSKLIYLQYFLSIRYILKYFQINLYLFPFVSTLQNFFFYLKKLLFRLAKFKKIDFSI